MINVVDVSAVLGYTLRYPELADRPDFRYSHLRKSIDYASPHLQKDRFGENFITQPIDSEQLEMSQGF